MGGSMTGCSTPGTVVRSSRAEVDQTLRSDAKRADELLSEAYVAHVAMLYSTDWV